MNKITEFLKSLGNTPEEVALSLKNLGITGYNSSQQNCPIAVAVRTLCGTIPCFVVSRIGVTFNDIQTIDPFTPKPVLEFISLFDKGYFPFLNRELIEREEEEAGLNVRPWAKMPAAMLIKSVVKAGSKEQRYDWTLKIGDIVKNYCMRNEDEMAAIGKAHAVSHPGTEILLFKHKLHATYKYPKAEVIEPKFP